MSNSLFLSQIGNYSTVRAAIDVVDSEVFVRDLVCTDAASLCVVDIFKAPNTNPGKVLKVPKMFRFGRLTKFEVYLQTREKRYDLGTGKAFLGRYSLMERLCKFK